MKKLMVGNWKMNQNTLQCKDFFFEFNKRFTNKREAWIAPQAVYIPMCNELGFKNKIQIGGQNCSEHLSGAYTGELSANFLKDVGAHFVILGHSERREHFKETSHSLNAKVRTALNAKLAVIYCVGETFKERESNQTLSIIEDQLNQGLNDMSRANAQNLIVAYEPVWAIGTGKTATPKEAQAVHKHIRSVLKAKFPDFGDKVRILYGGSVKPDNVEELLGQEDIDGALVGGASLKHQDFLALCGD